MDKTWDDMEQGMRKVVRMSSFSFLIFTLFLSLFGCKNDLAEIERVMGNESLDVERMKAVEILYSDSAIVRVRISAPVMIRHLKRSAPSQEFPEGIKVDFFDNYKRISSVMTAKYAIRDENSKEILVRDSVVWESYSDDMLETEELVWDERNEKVYTEKFVTITRPEEIIYGYGFEANQDFTYSKIKAIEGTIKIDAIGEEFD